MAPPAIWRLSQLLVSADVNRNAVWRSCNAPHTPPLPPPSPAAPGQLLRFQRQSDDRHFPLADSPACSPSAVLALCSVLSTRQGEAAVVRQGPLQGSDQRSGEKQEHIISHSHVVMGDKQEDNTRVSYVNARGARCL